MEKLKSALTINISDGDHRILLCEEDCTSPRVHEAQLKLEITGVHAILTFFYGD